MRILVLLSVVALAAGEVPCEQRDTIPTLQTLQTSRDSCLTAPGPLANIDGPQENICTFNQMQLIRERPGIPNAISMITADFRELRRQFENDQFEELFDLCIADMDGMFGTNSQLEYLVPPHNAEAMQMMNERLGFFADCLPRRLEEICPAIPPMPSVSGLISEGIDGKACPKSKKYNNFIQPGASISKSLSSLPGVGKPTEAKLSTYFSSDQVENLMQFFLPNTPAAFLDLVQSALDTTSTNVARQIQCALNNWCVNNMEQCNQMYIDSISPRG